VSDRDESGRIDLRGVMCPLNFVKAKLALEAVAPGAELEILLDDGEPVQNVPRSLADDGHAVVSLKRQEDAAVWLLHVRKAEA